MGGEDIAGRAGCLSQHAHTPSLVATAAHSPGLCHPSVCIFAIPEPPWIIPQPLPTIHLIPSLLLPPPSLSPIMLAPHLSREAGPLRVRDVILPQVPMQPVAEVEEAVIQRQQDVSDQAWGRGAIQRL